MILSLGERLRYIREYKKITQQELIGDFGTRQYLSKIENGEQQPSEGVLEHLAIKLKIPVCFLVDGTYDKCINDIYQQYFQTRKLSESDEIFLYLSTFNSLDTQGYLKVQAILLYYYARKSEKDIEYVEQLLLKVDKDKETICTFPQEGFRFYMSCGDCYYFSQRFHEADNYYVLAERLYKPDNPMELIDLYHSLSLTKQRTRRTYELCLMYSEKAYEIVTTFDIKERITLCVLNTLGIQYRLLTDYNKALFYIDEAIKLLEEIELENSFKSSLLTNKGKIYKSLKQNDIAVNLFHQSIEWNKQINNQSGTIYALREVIEICIEDRQLDIAKKYVDEAITIAKKYKFIYLFIELHRLDAHIERENGQIKEYERKLKYLIKYGAKNHQFLWIVILVEELAGHFNQLGDRKNSNIYYQKYFEYYNEIYS